jgi:hypothetical protein
LQIGTVGIVAYAYVFEKLGAEFLLGVNAIHENGLVIDGAQKDVSTRRAQDREWLSR